MGSAKKNDELGFHGQLNFTEFSFTETRNDKGEMHEQSFTDALFNFTVLIKSYFLFHIAPLECATWIGL